MTEGDERKEKEIMSEEIMAENFPKAMTNTKAQIQEAQRTQSRYMWENLHLGISYLNYIKSKNVKVSVGHSVETDLNNADQVTHLYNAPVSIVTNPNFSATYLVTVPFPVPDAP